MSPGASPSLRVSQPRVSPSGMKQMSWLSGFFAMKKPRAAASSRMRGFSVSPRGKKARAS